MLRSFSYLVLVMTVCTVMLLGCGAREVRQAETEQAQVGQVDCIGILPAAPWIPGKKSGAEEGQQVKNLRQGVRVMDTVLARQLKNSKNVRFVGDDRLAALQLSGGESPLELARLAGRRIGCNAILESTVKRFDERIGTRYSIESPASVAFEMRLISLDSGAVLWSAKFDEVQKSVMENVLEWKKAKTRSFVWITAEELMREGLVKKLAGSSYFSSGD